MTWVILPAAGSGTRMGAGIAKVHLPLLDSTLLGVTLQRLLDMSVVSGVMVVLASDDAHWQTPPPDLGKPVLTANGGATRMHSVLAGLQALPDSVEDEAWVAVHDAARPLISQTVFNHVLSAAQANHQGAIAALPVSDTLKRAADTREHGLSNALMIAHTQERSGLWRAQTPQIFKRGPLTRALEHCLAQQIDASDEAMAMEHCGTSAALVMGSEYNIKVTRPGDLELVNALLGAMLSKEKDE